MCNILSNSSELKKKATLMENIKIKKKKRKKEISITSLADGIAARKVFSTSLCSWVFPVEESAAMRLKKNMGN